MLFIHVLSSFVICCAVRVTLGYRITTLREWLRATLPVCGWCAEFLFCGNGLRWVARSCWTDQEKGKQNKELSLREYLRECTPLTGGYILIPHAEPKIHTRQSCPPEKRGPQETPRGSVVPQTPRD